MKRRMLPALLAAALLTGCGAPAETAPSEPQARIASLPETALVEPISAPAVVTQGRRASEKAYVLPEVAVERMADWSGDVALLAELPEREIAFYGVQDRRENTMTALLRWGDTLAEFDWSCATPRGVLPQLRCFDADGDGVDELVAECYMGSGTGVSISQLHIVEKSADGTLTDYCLPDTLFTDLTAALRVENVAERTYAVLGTELVDITARLQEGMDPAGIEGLTAGNIVAFDAAPDSKLGEYIRFRGSACLEGVDYPPTVWYVVDVDAVVDFTDGIFTLRDLHLNSIN